jgi:hypothetical protein
MYITCIGKSYKLLLLLSISERRVARLHRGLGLLECTARGVLKVAGVQVFKIRILYVRVHRALTRVGRPAVGTPALSIGILVVSRRRLIFILIARKLAQGEG